MKPAPLIALAALFPLPALAQSTTNSTVTFSLTWEELGNGNGDLSPGESALIKLTASFTNQNTVGSFSPPIGTFTSGTIRGLGAGFLDLIGTATNGANAAGSWNLANALLPAWDLVGPSGWGTPVSSGSILRDIQFGQFPVTPAGIITTNPVINIWQAAWTPFSYSGYYADFTLAAGSASGGTASTVMLSLGTLPAYAFTPTIFGSVRISVGIPDPATLPVLALAALGLQRRRPRSHP